MLTRLFGGIDSRIKKARSEAVAAEREWIADWLDGLVAAAPSPDGYGDPYIIGGRDALARAARYIREGRD